MRPILLSSILAAATLANAAVITVSPGPGTPVQDAIDAASPGDTIRLTAGTYPEQIVVTKRLKIRGAGSTSDDPGDTTSLTPPCGAGPVVSVQADDVLLRGMALVGAQGGGVDVVGRTRVKLQDVLVASNCPTVAAPAFNVELSTRVTMSKLWALGSQASGPPAGIRIASAPADGRIRLMKSVAFYYGVGVLLDGNGDRAVRQRTGFVDYNDRGILLRDTVGASIVSNTEVFFNTTTRIEIEAGSSGNSIMGNDVMGSTLDVVDAGSGNCWRRNTFTTGSVPACP